MNPASIKGEIFIHRLVGRPMKALPWPKAQISCFLQQAQSWCNDEKKDYYTKYCFERILFYLH
jgi:hypothetical protein